MSLEFEDCGQFSTVRAQRCIWDVRSVETLAQLKEKIVVSAAGGFSGVIYSVAPCLSSPAHSSEALSPELFFPRSKP